MLGVALGAMVLGCLLLVLVLKRYDFTIKAAAAGAPAASTALAANLENPQFRVGVHL